MEPLGKGGAAVMRPPADAYIWMRLHGYGPRHARPGRLRPRGSPRPVALRNARAVCGMPAPIGLGPRPGLPVRGCGPVGPCLGRCRGASAPPALASGLARARRLGGGPLPRGRPLRRAVSARCGKGAAPLRPLRGRGRRGRCPLSAGSVALVRLPPAPVPIWPLPGAPSPPPCGLPGGRLGSSRPGALAAGRAVGPPVAALAARRPRAWGVGAHYQHERREIK